MAVYVFEVYVDVDPKDGGKPVRIERDIADHRPHDVAQGMKRGGFLASENDWVPGERIVRVKWKKKKTKN